MVPPMSGDGNPRSPPGSPARQGFSSGKLLLGVRKPWLSILRALVESPLSYGFAHHAKRDGHFGARHNWKAAMTLRVMSEMCTPLPIAPTSYFDGSVHTGS